MPQVLVQSKVLIVPLSHIQVLVLYPLQCCFSIMLSVIVLLKGEAPKSLTDWHEISSRIVLYLSPSISINPDPVSPVCVYPVNNFSI